MGIELTETAAREIRAIIEQQELDQEKVCLRVGVKGGGCSGFSYLLDLTEQSAASHALTLEEVDGRPLPIRLRDGLARLFSPYL